MKQGIRLIAGGFTALAAAFTLASCGSSGSDPAEATIFAAASLTNVGEELATAFKEESPDAEITFNFAGSSALVRQISEGAPADMFISADVANMENALKLPEFRADSAEIIANNQLVLVTADKNPGQITELADLSDSLVALCAAEVPCGSITREALTHAHITLSTPSEEANVSDVTTKISTGAVDAGFIYSTDAHSLDSTQDNTIIELEGIEPNEYPVALTSTGEDNAIARAFAQFLTTDRARGILENHGFGTN